MAIFTPKFLSGTVEYRCIQKISNFTDFYALEAFSRIGVRYVGREELDMKFIYKILEEGI